MIGALGALVVAVAVPLALERTEAGDTAAKIAVRQAMPLAALCSEDRPRAEALGTDCDEAEAIARGVLDGTDGQDGEDGAPGLGIRTTNIVDGQLVLTFSDNTTKVVGRVLGEPGPNGEQGRGITATAVVDGRLIVTFSDGEVVDLGVIVGPAGVGIATMDGKTGRLLVTLTDGTLIDLGPLPPGPPGKDGADAPPAPRIASSTKTYEDGSSEVCKRIPDSPDTDPRFSCQRFPPPAPDIPTTEGGDVP